MTPAALGFRCHSGWAALVALAGDPSSPEVVDRRRIEMADAKLAGSKQPYHEAEGMALKHAAALLDRYARSARQMALEGLRVAIDDLRSKGYRPVGSALLLASGRGGSDLAGILASHALIHTADGEHFRDAIACASTGCGVEVTRLRERELPERAQATLQRPAPQLQDLVSRMGRTLGPPWTQDQKLAALAAWVVLAGGPGR